MTARYAQCDDTCTVDCGHCKGQGRPAADPILDLCDRLEEARAAATPGPWGLQFNEWMDGSEIEALQGDQRVTPEIRWNDAALIVAAVNALPELVAAIRAVHTLADELALHTVEPSSEHERGFIAGLDHAANSLRAAVATDRSGR